MMENLTRSIDEIMSEISMVPGSMPLSGRQYNDKIDRSTLQEKMASIGKVTGLLPHELLNPLDATRRYLNLAYNRDLEKEQSLEYIRKARQAMDRMTQMIQCILSFSADNFKEPRPVNVNALIENEIRELIHQRPSAVTVKALYDPRIEDAVLPGFELVIHHLVKNALDAMSGEGLLTVITQKDEHVIKIFIRDSGGGIPEEHAGRIFEPFFTTRRDNGHLGLGLTIAKEVVERSAGRLQLYNQYGKNLTCIIYVPTDRNGIERRSVL